MVRGSLVPGGAALVLLTALGAGVARAQQPEEPHPRIERLSFRGVEALDERELRRSIATEETRCRSFLLRPVCWVTDWGVFIDKQYLDRQALLRDELRLQVVYFRRGYRAASILAQTRPRGRGVEVIFDVDEGPPTLITAFDLQQSIDVLGGRRIARAGFPGEGEALDLIRLDAARTDIQLALENAGYLDASVRDSVSLATGAREAVVRVFVDPGPRSTLADFDIRGNEDVADRTIVKATVLRRGRVIRSSDVAAAQRSLYESNLFHEARVSVPEQADSAKRVLIEVREAPPRVGSVGGGFNTVEFIQVEGDFTHYNWLGGGRRLDVHGTVGNLLAPQLNRTGIFRDVLPRDPHFGDASPFLRPTWHVSVDVVQPAFRAAEQAVALGAFAHRRTVPGIAVDHGYGAMATFTRRMRDRSPLSLTYRFEVSGVEAGDLYFCVNYAICDRPTIEALRQHARLSPLALSYVWERVDHPVARTRGHRIRLDAQHAAGYTLSDFRYQRLSGTAARYIPLREGRNVLAGQIRAGWVRAGPGTAEALGLPAELGELLLLHPRKRFYAGGSQTVRGYGENQLGPRILTVDPEALTDPSLDQPCTPAQLADGSCDPNIADIEAFQPRPLGGTGVLQGNVEYRFPIWRQLTGAVFVDGAVVPGLGETLPGATAWAITPGFGGRYATRLGPIRFDLGIRPRVAERLPVVTEITAENGERRIVLLGTERHYDPVGDGGFLRQVLSRVRLHLSIGEAF